MDVHDNHNILKDILADLCKRLSDQDVVIVDTLGKAHPVFGPVTIYKDFIRFQDSTNGNGNQQTINVMYSQIVSVNHP